MEYLVTGLGDPVTVFAHGLGNGIAETRPLGSAVTGRRVFFQFRGHGRSAAPAGRWTYADLARDLRAVADLTGATRALGVSLGAGALCRLLAEHPGPVRAGGAVPARRCSTRPGRPPRGSASPRCSTRSTRATPPGSPRCSPRTSRPSLRNNPSTWSFLRQRMDMLMGDGLAPGLASLPEQIAVSDPATLADVADSGARHRLQGDELHPAAVAEQLAALLPNATLHIYDKPGVLWTQRADLRDRVATFLND